MNKRVHHLAFWAIYWAIMVYLDYFWLLDHQAGLINTHYLLLKAMCGTLLYITPLAALAYYITRFGLEFILDPAKSIVLKYIAILVPYLLTVLVVIAVMRLIVFPYIYSFDKIPGDVFIDPRRFLSIMIEAAFPAAFMLAVRFIDNRIATKERENNLVKEKLAAEIKLLKGQLNPHFLFNTLNNIYALTRKKSDEAPETVLKLSELLSFMLYETSGETITIGKEVKFLEDYIALQKIRFHDNLSLEFKKEIDDPDQSIAPLLLLPLVENAFKHGASENHFDSYIHIDLKLQQGILQFNIENSTETEEALKQPQKLGLQSTTRQLELLYGEQSLDIEKSKQAFKVLLTVNLNSYGKI
ncbi:histidine kinase [Pseudoflavitalea sp. G-6-1-2]|uniref:sensor histidine kinase n=1 Tax=Pseudoflavitalea sp. G-6-1-2 TaxID=2728841 RepID=UPI00146EF58D|nr:histidine kinase [Pseudoflavitalea sp. G-6-1-2]NML19539.1 histidine kinase [Pseudoflavitalea sp. G-6-1-2]